MGLLDNLLLGSNANFGGQQGGLLDFLRTSQMQNDQYQPSAGFPMDQPATFADRFGSAPGAPAAFTPAGRSFDTAQFDPATYAPNQAQPIAVGGNYQMPRIGGADQFTPPPSAMAAIPQNAQPTQGQMPATDFSAQSRPLQPTLPTFMGGPQQGAGFGDRLMAGVQNFANAGGPLQALAGGLNGLISGNRTDPQGMQQQNLRAQYEALVPALGPQKAMLAVMNPEAGKVLIEQALSNKEKFQKIGQNGLGQEQYGFVNEREQTVNGKPISQLPQDAGGGLGNMDLTGKDFLASLPKAQANTVQMMVEGKIAPPSSFALSKPYWQNMIAAAKNYDPTFDATAWSARVAGAKDFSAGKSAEMVRSANQTLHHVGSLLDSMDTLNNGNYPLLNKIGNAAAEATGSGAQGSFRSNAHAVATELSKVFKGSNLSDAEIHAWEQNLHENMSPEQQRTQILKLKELLQGSLHALEEKRLASLGPMAAEKAGPIIKEEGQRVLERIDNWAARKGGKSGSTAADPLGIR